MWELCFQKYNFFPRRHFSYEIWENTFEIYLRISMLLFSLVLLFLFLRVKGRKKHTSSMNRCLFCSSSSAGFAEAKAVPQTPSDQGQQPRASMKQEAHRVLWTPRRRESSLLVSHQHSRTMEKSRMKVTFVEWREVSSTGVIRVWHSLTPPLTPPALHRRPAVSTHRLLTCVCVCMSAEFRFIITSNRLLCV